LQKNPKQAPATCSLSDLVNKLGTDLAFKGAHGRTLVFEGKNGAQYGIKLKKKDEDVSEFEGEGTLLGYLNASKNALGLKSSLPHLIKTIRIVGIPEKIKKALAKASAGGKGFEIEVKGGVMAMVYEAPKDYFKFLNDPSLGDEEFMAASFRGLEDLFRLARHNLIHTALIELFHNVIQRGREDRGRFVWMVNTVRPMMSRSGTGRLHAWTSAVKFPNLRGSGLADLAHMARIEELTKAENNESVHLAPLHRFKGSTQNFFLASYLGDYLLAWSLLVGSRFQQKGELDWKDGAKVSRLAGVMKKGFTHAFSVYSGVPEKASLAFLGTIINWQRIAVQMSWCMSDAYVEALKTRKVPQKIYGKGVKVIIPNNMETMRGWTDKGWSFDGKNPDLGPVNGSFPAQELIRTLYLLTSFMIAARQSLTTPPEQPASI